jgi:hypothetical protein
MAMNPFDIALLVAVLVVYVATLVLLWRPE